MSPQLLISRLFRGVQLRVAASAGEFQMVGLKLIKWSLNTSIAGEKANSEKVVAQQRRSYETHREKRIEGERLRRRGISNGGNAMTSN